MKKKDVFDVTSMLDTFIKAGAGAQEIMNAIISQQKYKNKNFVFVFQNLRVWIESENPEVVLTKAERSVCFTGLPYIGWNNQIELTQSDFQRLSGYKDRKHFRLILKSLEHKNVLVCKTVGRDNYWFFNPLLAKKGNTESKNSYIKFNLKD